MAEYALADKLLSEMKPMSMVMGWHSYRKDLEREYVTLTSHYGHRVEGLHTLPERQLQRTGARRRPGFVYKNNHTIVPGKTVRSGKEGVRHVRADRRYRSRCMAEARPRRDPLRLGGADELHLDGAGDGGVLLHAGHAQRLFHRMPLRSRLHVSRRPSRRSC